MTLFDDVHSEERAARDQLQRMRRLSRAAQQAREREWRQRLAAALAATRHRFPRCRCGLRRGMTPDELRALGAGCGAPSHVCPRLDAVRRRVAR